MIFFFDSRAGGGRTGLDAAETIQGGLPPQGEAVAEKLSPEHWR
jgi:hypothetical protein